MLLFQSLTRRSWKCHWKSIFNKKYPFHPLHNIPEYILWPSFFTVYSKMNMPITEDNYLWNIFRLVSCCGAVLTYALKGCKLHRVRQKRENPKNNNDNRRVHCYVFLTSCIRGWPKAQPNGGYKNYKDRKNYRRYRNKPTKENKDNRQKI